MATWNTPKSNYGPGDQVTPSIFNTLGENEEYLNETKITTEQVQEATVNSSQSSTRTNLLDAETVKAAFGKIRKWFADLGSLAFKSTVGSSDIASNAVTQGKIDSHAVTYGKIATGAVRTDKIEDLAVTTAKLADAVVTAVKLAVGAVTTEKIAAGAVTDEKIATVSAGKVTGLATVATTGSYNDLTNKPSFSSGVTFEKYTFQFNKQYNIPATGIYLCFVKYTNSGGFTNIACLGTMSNSPNVDNGTYSGVSSIYVSGIRHIQVRCEPVSTTALKYQLYVSTSATTMPNTIFEGDGEAQLIMYKIGNYSALM